MIECVVLMPASAMITCVLLVIAASLLLQHEAKLINGQMPGDSPILLASHH
jgi:hypothetical protein